MNSKVWILSEGQREFGHPMEWFRVSLVVLRVKKCLHRAQYYLRCITGVA